MNKLKKQENNFILAFTLHVIMQKAINLLLSACLFDKLA